MAIWLVKAKPKERKLSELRMKLNSGLVSRMRPFGISLDSGLRNARIRNDGYAVWEEEDYCVPPLAQEREAVLDEYFDDLTVEDIGEEGRGWEKIEKLPLLWAPREKRNSGSARLATNEH